MAVSISLQTFLFYTYFSILKSIIVFLLLTFINFYSISTLSCIPLKGGEADADVVDGYAVVTGLAAAC
ncbi:hypothetical protein PRECH8_10240 [Insulibacter thermoxylanivorax]|uniref:Uncharacterized protein n=1 Tax=Insulibacter thermoxylanivorax TaxID=2749268 RepID=A0A916QES0_9BACL|nr:hypothetical protein PRECH8_10240 [Insulibacter thermoxylanivorax]